MSGGLVKRSLILSGHRTSVALESGILGSVGGHGARARHGSAQLIAAIDAARDPARPLASALRVAALHAQQARADLGAEPTAC
jgi:predicted DNA-binding ribbon-helix-helix protein